MGAVRSLRMLHECHGALRGDTLVVEAGGLLPLPYDRLMEHHHCTGADLTIVEAAGPGTARATSPLGAWVVSPRCLDALCDLGTLATLADLLAALPGSGLRLARFRHKGAAYPLSGPRAYFSLLADALDGRIAGLTPSGERLAPRIWVDSGAQLPADLRTDGALHVGARARIDAGAELRGTNFIGSDARIAGKTLLRNAVIWPETRVGDGAIVDTTIASGAWAINHRFAGSQAAARLPLEGLAPLEPQRAAAAPLKLGRAARIA